MKNSPNSKNTTPSAESTGLRASVDAAWENRWVGQIESVIRAYPELRAELGLPLLGNTSRELEKRWKEKTSDTQDALLRSDALLLSSSLARLRGKFEQASELIVDSQALLNEAGLSGSFRLHFERALLAFTRGDYLPAIEDFFSASRYTGKKLFRLSALTNALFCLENLGIDARETAAEIETLRTECREQDAEQPHPILRAIESQLRAYRMRTAFRSGSVASAIGEVPNASLQAMDQPVYYARWIQLLPYIDGARAVSQEESVDLLKNPHAFFQRGYRVRTLLGQTHAEDQDFVKLSDRIDRLYLWTWLWLGSPQSTGADRLMKAVNEVVEKIELANLTLEDQFLLRNALGWLGLADPSLGNKLRVLQNKLQPASGQGFALFEMEWSIIRLLSAKATRQETLYADTLRSIENHPLWNSSAVLLSELVKGLQAPDSTHALHEMARNILSRTLKTGETQSARLVIDLNSHVIRDVETDRETASPSMVAAFRILSTGKPVSVEDFVRETFGIFSYDSFIHNPKIFNLISRMRAVVHGRLTFRVKAGAILTEGDWTGIEFVEPFRLTQLLRGEVVDLRLSPLQLGEASPRKHVALARLQKSFGSRGTFTRAEAQAAMDLSKSSVTRVLDKMVQEGKLDREGSARATLYRFKAEGSRVPGPPMMSTGSAPVRPVSKSKKVIA